MFNNFMFENKIFMYKKIARNLLSFGIVYILISCLSFLAWANDSNVIKTEQGDVKLFTATKDKIFDTSKFLRKNIDSKDVTYAALQFNLKEGWYIYWKDPGDVGFPLKINWQKSNNIGNLNILWPYPQKELEKINDIILQSNIYRGQVVFPLQIQLNDRKQDTNINLTLDYAICSKICIPAKVNLSLLVKADYKNAQYDEIIENALTKIPQNPQTNFKINQIIYAKQHKKLIIKTSLPSPDSNKEVFIENGELINFAGTKFVAKEYKRQEGKEEKISLFTANVNYVGAEQNLQNHVFNITIINDDKSIFSSIEGNKLIIANTEKDLADVGLTSTILSDDGLLAKNMNVSDVQNKVGDATNDKLLLIIFFAFIGGVILNFMPCVLPVLAIKILSAIKSGNDKIRQNFLAAAAGIIFAIMVLAILVIILKSFGANIGWGFQFQEPIFLGFLALIMTLFASSSWGLVSISMGNLSSKLLGRKFSSDIINSFFSGILATLLATPCTAPFLGAAAGFALSSSALNIIIIFFTIGLGLAFPYLLIAINPRIFKYFPKAGKWMVGLKFIMGLALYITMLWLAKILIVQIGMALALIFVALNHLIIIILLLMRKIKYLKAVIIFICAIALGFIILGKNGYWVANESIQEASNAEVKLADDWIKFDAHLIDKLLEENKIIFVDITADWCLTCKTNEILVINSQEIQDKFKEYKVVKMRGDLTRHDEAITSFLKQHKRSGIPFNIIYSAKFKDGIILSELLSKDMVQEALAKAK